MMASRTTCRASARRPTAGGGPGCVPLTRREAPGGVRAQSSTPPRAGAPDRDRHPPRAEPPAHGARAPRLADDAAVGGPRALTERERAAEAKVVHAAAEVSHSVSGVLSRPSAQAFCYAALGGAAAGAGLAALLFPGLLAAGLLSGGPAAMIGADAGVSAGASAAAAAALGTRGAAEQVATAALVRLVGAAALTSAAVNFTLREAARRGQLALPTFRRLNAAGLLHGMLGLTVLSQGFSIRTPQLTAFVGALCGASVLVAGRLYGLYKRGAPVPSPRATASAVLSLLTPRGGAAAALAAGCVALAAAAASCWSAGVGSTSAIWGTTPLAPPGVFAARLAGAGMLLQSVVAYSLKDAADRGKLGATSSRWLKLGLSAGLLSAGASLGIASLALRSAGAAAGSQGAAPHPAVAAAFLLGGLLLPCVGPAPPGPADPDGDPADAEEGPPPGRGLGARGY